MGAFLTQLAAVKIAEASSRGRAEWMLAEPLVFESHLAGRISVPAGFRTDFSSVPRLPIAFMLAGDTAHASAVVHDYLCREWYPACRISWRVAADVFSEAMRDEGVPAWRRAIMRLSLIHI